MDGRRWGLLAVVLGCAFGQVRSACGAPMQTWPLRSLSAGADVIVVAEPLGSNPPRMSVSYRVLEVVKGAGLAPGDRVLLDDVGCYFYEVRMTEHSPPVPQFKKALLFLRYPAKATNPPSFSLCSSGIRVVDDQDRLRFPEQWGNPGGFHFSVAEGMTWDRMLADVRRDLPEIEGLHTIGRITDKATRNRVVFSWLERHEADVARPITSNWMYVNEKSWGGFDYQVFHWVMESCLPDDCWRAVELAVKLNLTLEPGAYPSFATQEGRTLLMAKAFDEKLPEPLRLKALAHLGMGSTYFHNEYFPNRRNYVTRAPNEREQTEIWKKLATLLTHPTPAFRQAAAKAIRATSTYNTAYREHDSTLPAVPTLVDAYRKETDSAVRWQLLEAICWIESRESWTNQVDNPGEIVALVVSHGEHDGKLRFELILHSKLKLRELPELLFEKRDKMRGDILKTLRITPELESPADPFAAGWNSGSVFVTVPKAKLKREKLSDEYDPIRNWKVTAIGRVEVEEMGKPVERTWKSETMEVRYLER